MLALELTLKHIELVGLVQELSLRISVIIAVEACKFHIVSGICRNAINDGL